MNVGKLASERLIPHDELPDVDELRERVPLLDNDLLGPLDPRRVLVIARRQPHREGGCENVERLLDERARVGLEGAQQRHVDLQDDLRRRVVDLDEAADVHVRALLGLRVLTLQVVPAKLDELFAVLH